MIEDERAPVVLVVDDFDDAREMLCELLTDAGHQVVVAADGGEALALAREVLPRVVLLDLSLPVLSGWDVARALKSNPATASICIIACTAHVHAREHDLALEAGCSRVLTKPIDTRLLLAVVAETLEKGL
ncbi:MAG: response regulator [Myxococcota bacterium]|nr:response regulator [Myxococcota bacterium]